MFGKKNNNKQTKVKDKNLEQYIYLLENEKTHLKSDIRTLERQMNRQRSNYLEPIRNILDILDYDCSEEQKINYIKTQLSNFMIEKNLEIFAPVVGKNHDKSTMIVEEIIPAANKKDNDKIESVIAIGIKSNDNVIVPAKVRIYKGE